MSSWRAGTSKQYNTYLNKWAQYCDQNKLSKFNPGLDEAIEFLTLLFESGLGYSALNTARSALSSILPLMEGVKFGEHPLVCRYLKGVFELRPTLPRYTEIWNVDTVLRYLTTLKPALEMTMKELSLRLTMLLCLLTAQRCQTVHQFDINCIQEFESKYRITVQQKLKQSRPGKHLEPIELVEFVPDRKLCVVTHLREYIKRTQDVRGRNTQLLLSYVKPFKPVTKATISRWVKMVLKQAGIDVGKYTAHSSRAAATSHVIQQGFNLQEIMKSAGWTSASTFERFYHKPTEQAKTFGEVVLDNIV
jgi:hypothetical protein